MSYRELKVDFHSADDTNCPFSEPNSWKNVLLFPCAGMWTSHPTLLSITFEHNDSFSEQTVSILYLSGESPLLWNLVFRARNTGASLSSVTICRKYRVVLPAFSYCGVGVWTGLFREGCIYRGASARQPSKMSLGICPMCERCVRAGQMWLASLQTGIQNSQHSKMHIETLIRYISCILAEKEWEVTKNHLHIYIYIL